MSVSIAVTPVQQTVYLRNVTSRVERVLREVFGEFPLRLRKGDCVKLSVMGTVHSPQGSQDDPYVQLYDLIEKFGEVIVECRY